MKKKIIKKTYNFLVFLDSSKAAFLIFSEIVLGILLSVIASVLFYKITSEVFENDLSHFDLTVINFVYQFRNPLLTKIMVAISFLGNDFIILLSFLVIIFLLRKKYKHEAVLFTFVLVIGFAINTLLKTLIKRTRPMIAPLINESFYSFPSGHAMNSIVFYGLVAFYVFRFTRNKRLAFIISVLCVSLAILIGLSRIYLGVHYPSDILAGFVGGFWWIVTALLLEKSIMFIHLFKKEKKPSA